MTDGRTDALTFGFVLGTSCVRKSSQESVSTQQIPDIFNGINLEKFRKFKVANNGPFVITDERTDGMTDYPNPIYPHPLFKAGLKLGNEHVKLIEMGKSFGINGLIVLLLSCGCWCFVSLPHGAMGWPVIYDCVISQASRYECIIEINFLYFSHQNICYGYSKETSQWDGSFELPKHMFKLMGKKIIKIRKYNFLILTNDILVNLLAFIPFWILLISGGPAHFQF